jgi:MoxR-like ATPase
MQPHDLKRRSLDPVEIARRRGAAALFELLRDGGRYVATQRPLRALRKALCDEHPLLLEGERGSGKTAMPEALALACNLPLFFFPCMDGVTVEEMLASFDANVQTQHVVQQIAAGVPSAEAQASQWTLPFLNFGEIGAAYQYAATTGFRCVLCIDEIDKLDERREDALLQVLARGYFDVPRLAPDSRVGSVPRADGARPLRPLVFLTSNNMRGGISSPTRSRCYYSHIKYPSQVEQIAILRVQVPDAPAALVVQVVKLLTYIRGMTGVTEKPALREMIDLTRALHGDGVTLLTREIIEDAFCVFVKLSGDEDAITNRMTTVEDIVNKPQPEIDLMVAKVYGVSARDLVAVDQTRAGINGRTATSRGALSA